MFEPELEEDEFGRDLILRGIVHEVIFSESRNWMNKALREDYAVFVGSHRAPNGFNLTKRDCIALYNFLEKYVKD